MSMFLPETPPSAVQQTDFKPYAETPTLDGDIALMQRIFSAAVANPSQIPSDFLAYLIDFIQTQRLNIPIGQVIGFSGFTAQTAYDATLCQTSSAAFQNKGPSLHGLATGSYLALWGSQAEGGGAGSYADMDLFLNGTDLGISAVSATTTFTSVMAAGTFVVTSPGATLECRYKSSDGVTTCSWQGRILILLRYANH